MHKRILKSGLTLALLILSLSATAFAQNTAQNNISPEKKALIKEMLAASDVQKMGDMMMKATMDQLETGTPARIAESVNSMPNLTRQEREKMIRTLTDDNARFTKRFRELTKEKINWLQLVEELMYPIVDKYFTEDDLKNMIAFYKSPAGKKVLEVMPQMMTEIMIRSEEIAKPRFEAIANQILEEEKKRVDQ
jgi:hypothetical protein